MKNRLLPEWVTYKKINNKWESLKRFNSEEEAIKFVAECQSGDEEKEKSEYKIEHHI